MPVKVNQQTGVNKHKEENLQLLQLFEIFQVSELIAVLLLKTTFCFLIEIDW